MKTEYKVEKLTKSKPATLIQVYAQEQDAIDVAANYAKQHNVETTVTRVETVTELISCHPPTDEKLPRQAYFEQAWKIGKVKKTRDEMTRELIGYEIEGSDRHTIADLFQFGCKGLDNLTDDELTAEWTQVFVDNVS